MRGTPNRASRYVEARLEACRVLKEVGTAKSLDVLGEIGASDENALVRRTAKEAVEAIKKRGNGSSV